MNIKYDNIEEITKNQFCNYYQEDCFKCVYRLTDKEGLWCRVEGKYVYKYKTDTSSDVNNSKVPK